MARNNNNFLHKKTLITANSVTVETLDDSAEAYLRAVDSDQVKTVDGFPGANISPNSIQPTSIANQIDIVSGAGGLTSGGVLGSAVRAGNTFINYDSGGYVSGAGFVLYPSYPVIPANANIGYSAEYFPYIQPGNEPSYDRRYKFFSTGQFSDALLDSGLAIFGPSNYSNKDRVVSQDSAYSLVTRTAIGPGTPSFDGTIPLFAKGNIEVHLNTPNPTGRDIIQFFAVGAGADSDQISAIQILDSAPASDPAASVYFDDLGNAHYLKLLDSLDYNDLSPTYGNLKVLVNEDPSVIADTTYHYAPTTISARENTISTHVGDSDGYYNIINKDIRPITRSFKGLKGIKLANGVPEFTSDTVFPTVKIRNTASRIRFKTRKSTGLNNLGAAPSTYGQDAPEMPIGVSVSTDVWSNVSPRFIYRVESRPPMLGTNFGYRMGGIGGLRSRMEKYNYVTDQRIISDYAYSNHNSPNGGLLNVSATQAELRYAKAGSTSLTAAYMVGSRPAPVVTKSVIVKIPFASEYNFYVSGQLANPATSSDTYSPNRVGLSSDTHGYTSAITPVTTPGGPVLLERFPFSSEGVSLDVPYNGIASDYYNVAASNGDESKGYLYMSERPGIPNPTAVRPVVSFTYASSAVGSVHAEFNTSIPQNVGHPGAATLGKFVATSDHIGLQSNTHGYLVQERNQYKMSFASGAVVHLSGNPSTTISPIPIPTAGTIGITQFGSSSSPTAGYLTGGFDPRPNPQGGPVSFNTLRKFDWAAETGFTTLSSVGWQDYGESQHISY